MTSPLESGPGHQGRVVLLFPGQGAQHEQMAVGLYHSHQRFRDLVDQVFELWGGEGAAIRADWLAAAPAIDIDDLRRAQPLLFAVDYALGAVVMEWGVVPRALLGHSVGEVAAAVLAGVLTLPDAAVLLADRIRQLADAPPGGMLAVAAAPQEVAGYLEPGVDVGAVNASRQILLAGPERPLVEVASRLRAAGFTCRPARARTPFHSRVIAEAATRSLPALRSLSFRAPTRPMYSGYTGARLTPAHATDPHFWVTQPARPVLFADALSHIAELGDAVYVEAGPGQSLTGLARRTAARRSEAVALLPRPLGGGAEAEQLAAARERLDELGVLGTKDAVTAHTVGI